MGTWAQHAHKNGYELVIMLIPDAEEVQWPSSPARLAQQASKRDIFVNAAKYWGVRVIDPVAKLRAHWCQTQEALYFNQDGHWNTAGHRFIGDWLADEL